MNRPSPSKRPVNMETPTPSRILRRAPMEIGPACLALRHLPRVWVWSLPGFHPPSCVPFAPSPLQGLLRYYGRSDSCPAALRFLTGNMNSVSVRTGLPNSRTRSSDPSVSNHSQSLGVAFARYPSARRISRLRVQASPFGRRLAGSGSRIEFALLRMNRSPPVAPHPASRRRSYSRFHAGERMHEGDLHPYDQVRS